MKNKLIALFWLTAIGGCADKSPLVFVSKTSVGVDVSTPVTGEFNASIGINTLDAAYVPVAEITSGDEVLNVIKSGETLTPGTRDQLATKIVGQIKSETENIALFKADLGKATDAQAKAIAQKQMDLARKRVQTLSEDLTNVLSRDDALSVFSAFDSNTLLRPDSAGQGIGKIFATGLAAQSVARSFNQQELALATCKSQIAPTAAKLAAETDQASKTLALQLLAACQ